MAQSEDGLQAGPLPATGEPEAVKVEKLYLPSTPLGVSTAGRTGWDNPLPKPEGRSEIESRSSAQVSSQRRTPRDLRVGVMGE